MLTLDECKLHLNIELDNPYHDDRLDQLRESAAAWACNFCNVESLEVFDDDSPPASPFTLPEDLKSAMKFHVQAMFSTDQAMMELLFKRAEALIFPYRRELGV